MSKKSTGIIGIMVLSLIMSIYRLVPSYIREKHSKEIFRTLDVETVIARCGKPLGEQTEALAPNYYFRNFIYQGSGGKVILRFMGSQASGYMFVDMRDEVGTWYTDARERIDHLPCLDSQ